MCQRGKGYAPWTQDFVQHRTNLPQEQLRILAHREMAESVHRAIARTGNHRGQFLAEGRRAAPIVLTVQDVERACLGIDARRAVAHIVIDRVVVEVALEDRGRALAVHPCRLAAKRLRACRGHHAVHEVRLEIVADFRVVELVVVAARGVSRGLKTDQRAEICGMVDGEIHCEMAADGTPHVYRAVEVQRPRQGHRHAHQEVLGQPVRFAPPGRLRRRDGLAVERKVVGDQPKLVAQPGVLQHMAPLPAVRSGRVLQQHRHAGPGLFEVHPVVDAIEFQVDIASHRRVKLLLSHGVVSAAPPSLFTSRITSMRRRMAG